MVLVWFLRKKIKHIYTYVHRYTDIFIYDSVTHKVLCDLTHDPFLSIISHHPPLNPPRWAKSSSLISFLASFSLLPPVLLCAPSAWWKTVSPSPIFPWLTPLDSLGLT